MRLFDAEMNVRLEQRQRYFENPSYRKWSDIVPNCIYRNYEGLPDDDFSYNICLGIVKTLLIRHKTFVTN